MLKLNAVVSSLLLIICSMTQTVLAAEISYEDRQDVYDLINRYSFGVDTYDTDLLMTLFTEEGVFRVYNGGRQVGNREGREARYTEFTERAQNRIQNGAGQSRHFITNIVIDQLDENHIVAKVMAMSTNMVPGEPAPTVNAIGYYDFEFVKVNEQWKIDSLELHYD